VRADGHVAEAAHHVLIVDTHCHALPHWFEPVETLLYQMNLHGVQKAALLQVMGQFDNAYLFDCVRRFPGRFSPTIIVDIRQASAPQAMEQWARQGAEGIRLHVLTRSPGADDLAVWRTAAELGLVVSAYGKPEEIASDEFESVFRQFPSLRICIEHLAWVGPDAEPPYPLYQKALSLARYPNAYMKFCGLGEICKRPVPFPDPMTGLGPVPATLAMAYDAFGAKRMMWGSDFPPVASREGYRNALRWTMEAFPARSEEDKAWLFGKTAQSLFGFGESAQSSLLLETQ
jgi:L-fuconolactonase